MIALLDEAEEIQIFYNSILQIEQKLLIPLTSPPHLSPLNSSGFTKPWEKMCDGTESSGHDQLQSVSGLAYKWPEDHRFMSGFQLCLCYSQRDRI